MRGNLSDLAATGIASEPTLRKWIAAEPDQPWILKRGKNGDAYEIDLAGAVAAFQENEEARTQAARERADSIRQFGLELGLGGREEHAVGLSIAERKQLLEEELVAIKIAKERRELVERASVAAAFGDVLVKFRQRGDTFAARVAKKVDLSREQITAIESLVRADQVELARLMEQMDLGEQRADGSHPAAAVEDPALLDRG